ncbi:uncharacterized protein LOC129619071 [Condylostylus longicornis]|uniref:uncharacterized protein LOC129619071 n=1 Tax=Condylostylus longicornis TaxID=2530218 RepID=UPI00244DDCC5|nr:uncharacterized protein LOC129619071 [Condylostylus longicornis]
MFNFREHYNLFAADANESTLIKKIQSVQEEIFIIDLVTLITEIFLAKIKENNKLFKEQISLVNYRNKSIKEIAQIIPQIENKIRKVIHSSMEVMLNSQKNFFCNYYHSTFQTKFKEDMQLMRNYIQETDKHLKKIYIVAEYQKLISDVNEIKKKYKVRREELLKSSRSLEQHCEETKKQMNKSIVDLVEILKLENELHNIQYEIEKKTNLCKKRDSGLNNETKESLSSDEDELRFVAKLPILDEIDFQSSLIKRITDYYGNFGQLYELHKVTKMRKVQKAFKASIDADKIKTTKKRKISSSSQSFKKTIDRDEAEYPQIISPNLLLEKPFPLNFFKTNSSAICSAQQQTFNEHIADGVRIVDCVKIKTANHDVGDAVSEKNFDLKIQKIIPENKRCPKILRSEIIKTQSTPNIFKKVGNSRSVEYKSPKVISPTLTEYYFHLKRKNSNTSSPSESAFQKQMKKVYSTTHIISKNKLSSQLLIADNNKLVGGFDKRTHSENKLLYPKPKIYVFDGKPLHENLKASEIQQKNYQKDAQNVVSTSSISKSTEQSVRNSDFKFEISDILRNYNNSSIFNEMNSVDFAFDFNFEQDKEQNNEVNSSPNCNFFNVDQTSGSSRNEALNFDFNFGELNSNSDIKFSFE